MQITWHKRGVLVVWVLDLAPGYELVLETLFRVGRRQRNSKTPDSQQVLRLGTSSNLNISHQQQNENQAGNILGRYYWEKQREEGWVEKERLEGYLTNSADIWSS